MIPAERRDDKVDRFDRGGVIEVDPTRIRAM